MYTRYDYDQILDLYRQKVSPKDIAEAVGGTVDGVRSALRRLRYGRVDCSMTLCWKCVHSVPSADGTHGCPWSVEGEPVEGWTATPTTITVQRYRDGTNHPSQVRSYHVQRCPRFVKEPERKEVFCEL